MSNMHSPDARQFLEAFGVEPESLKGELGVNSVAIEVDSDELLSIVYDIVGRSVRIKWNKDGLAILDVYREFVTDLAIESSGDMVVRSSGEDFASEMTIGIYPVRVADRTLAQ